jgi:PhnB protein
MAIKQLNAYLNFDGTAAKAIELYQRALGATVENLQRFSDVPSANPTPAAKDRVMHASLKMVPGVGMLSDTPPGMPFTAEGNAHAGLDFDAAADMAQRSDALPADGKMTMPLEDTFWGAKFGMLMDAFGVRWMFNCETKR